MAGLFAIDSPRHLERIMSVAIDLLVENLKGNLQFAKMTVADMTDADLIQRPCDQSTPGLYQMGHVIAAEAAMMGKLYPDFKQAPESWSKAYFGGCPSDEELLKTATKDQLVAEFDRIRSDTIAIVEKMADEDLAKPSHQEWAPTIRQLILGLDNHLWMHWGQIQVLRRKLGKKVLF
jgi:hypothetical protein